LKAVSPALQVKIKAHAAEQINPQATISAANARVNRQTLHEMPPAAAKRLEKLLKIKKAGRFRGL